MRTIENRRGLASLLTVLAMAGSAAFASAAPPDESRQRTIRAATSTGRQGVYYVPSDHEFEALPLLVILHGAGGSGSAMMSRVRALAERERFIAVAPDSVSVIGTWLVAEGKQRPTPDHRHIVASVREVLAREDVFVDRARILIAGFSVGGAAAASIASRDALFTAFGVLHGHVDVAALGPRRPRVWLSTGDRDRARTVEHFRVLTEQLEGPARFSEVTSRVFRGDHSLGDDELAALIVWWLRR